MKKNSFIVFILFLLVFTPLIPERIAEAGAVGSSGSAGGGPTGGGNYRTPLQWVVKRDVPENTIIRDTHRGSQLFSLPKSDSIAYVTTKTYQKGYVATPYPNNWYRWMHWMEEGHGDPSSSYNKLMWSESHLLPNDFRQEAINSGYATVSKAGALYKRGADHADLIWVVGANIKKESSDTVTTVIKYTNSRDTTRSFDNTGKSNEWLFNNPKTKVPYSYTSPEDQFSFNHSMSATSKTITKKTTWEEDSSGTKSSSKTTWSSSNQKSTTVSATWAANIPDLSYSAFKPLDLRTEKKITDSILKKYYTLGGFKNTAIIATLDNGKGEGEANTETPTQMLDTNAAKKFKVAFNNDQFGIPTKAQGGIDVSKNKPGYSAGIDRVQIYWNPKMNMASSVANYNPNRTSMEFGGTEYKGQTVLSKDRGWRGGDFLYRSIKSGKYNLGYDGKPFWHVDLETGKYFKYGGKYSGNITPSNDGPKFSSANSSGKVTVNGTNKWTGFVNMDAKQPILYGEFEVKTVGGYKR